MMKCKQAHHRLPWLPLGGGGGGGVGVKLSTRCARKGLQQGSLGRNARLIPKISTISVSLLLEASSPPCFGSKYCSFAPPHYFNGPVYCLLCRLHAAPEPGPFEMSLFWVSRIMLSQKPQSDWTISIKTQRVMSRLALLRPSSLH